jgi:hypothetical protein
VSQSNYAKYIVTEPKVQNVAYHPIDDVKGVTFPDEIYLDSELVPGCPVLVDIGWRFTVPDPDPVEWTHEHEFDEVLNFIGTDPDNPHDLGAEVEVWIGGEMHVITTTTSVFVPKGVPHCPLIHRRVDRPFLLVVVAMGGHYPSAIEDALQHPEKYGSHRISDIATT